MSHARVESLAALRDARVALLTCADRLRLALAAADAEIARVAQWLNQDRPLHWRAEIRRREDECLRARQEIQRKRLIAAPDPAAVSLEQRQVERANARLEEARRRLEHVRRWAVRFERDALTCKSACTPLHRWLDDDVSRAVARLEAMLVSLEAYLRIHLPVTPPDSPAPHAASPASPPETVP